MSDINNLSVSGNLGKDPEYRETQGGTGLAKASLAVSESYKDKSGSWQKRTLWLEIVLWGKRARLFADMFHKGDKVFLQGTLQQEEWEGKDGTKRTTLQINVRDFAFKPKNKGGGQSSRSDAGSFDDEIARAQAQHKGGDDLPDDLPF